MHSAMNEYDNREKKSVAHTSGEGELLELHTNIITNT